MSSLAAPSSHLVLAPTVPVLAEEPGEPSDLRTLPPPFRSAVVLGDVHGQSYDQVAAALGIKVGTVRSRLHRGRAQLRTALAHRAPNPALPTQATDRAA